VDGAHDLGGMQGYGAVVPDGEPFHEPWELRLFALAEVVASAELSSGHFRAAIESMSPREYLSATYFERWLYGLERRLERAGAVAPGEVEAAMRRLGDGPLPERSDPRFAESCVEAERSGFPFPIVPIAAAPRFAPGERVRVRRMHPAGHTRCPRYVRGATGEVERVHGAERLPDAVALGRESPLEAVYAVSFGSADLFGPGDEPPHAVLVDLSESYLESPD
jgi:nitrile hydratase subunit beta